jgi:hypothetical protein
MHELECFFMFVFGFVQGTGLCNLHPSTSKRNSFMSYKIAIADLNLDIAKSVPCLSL